MSKLNEIMRIYCCKCGAFIKSEPSAVAGTSRGGYCPKCYAAAMEEVKAAVKGRK